MNGFTEEDLKYLNGLGGNIRLETPESGTILFGSDPEDSYSLHVARCGPGYEAWITDGTLTMPETLSLGSVIHTTVVQAFHNAVVTLRRRNDLLEEKL